MKQPYLFLLLLFSMLTACSEDELVCQYKEVLCEYSQPKIDSTKMNRKVLIIGIDGFRADAMREDISPFMYSLSKQPETYYTDQNTVETLTFSGPNWSSLLTGVNWCKHNVKSNDFENNRIFEFEHFYKYIEQADSSINTASLVGWLPINEHLASAYADYSPQIKISDQEVFEQAQNILINGTPIETDILFLQFDELDGVGHDFGFSPNVEEYANMLSYIDSYINSLLNTIETKRSFGENWMVFIVSDHGGEGTGHRDGHNNPNINKTIFFANHPTLNFQHSKASAQVNLTPTILHFMGIHSQEFDCKKDGNSILQ